jgi:membrane associated rhomboid family serine protease
MIPARVDGGQRPPLLMPLLALACLSAWALSAYVTGSAHPPAKEMLSFGLVPDWLTGAVPRPEAYGLVPLWLTPLTAILVHDGILQLLFNVVWLWLFGRRLELSLGILRCALLMLGVTYGSALFQSVAAGGSEPVIGASGLVAGVLGAFIVLHPKAELKVFVLAGGFLRTMAIPAALVLLAWWVEDLLVAIDAVARGHTDGIAQPAHLSGFLLGMALATVLRPATLPLFDAGKPWPTLNPAVELVPAPGPHLAQLEKIFGVLTKIAVFAVVSIVVGLIAVGILLQMTHLKG